MSCSSTMVATPLLWLAKESGGVICHLQEQKKTAGGQARSYLALVNAERKIVHRLPLYSFEEIKAMRIANPFFKELNLHREGIEGWVCTSHGATALEKGDMFFIASYSAFVKEKVDNLEADGLIDPDLFIVPQPAYVKQNSFGGLSLMQEKVQIQDVEDVLKKMAPLKRAKLANDLAHIIWETGFADAHFGNFCPTAEGKWALVDCKPFGSLFCKKAAQIDLEVLKHNRQIGIEKLKGYCGQFQYPEMVESLDAFLKERPFTGKECLVCQELLA